jgi:hypothetical protein
MDLDRNFSRPGHLEKADYGPRKLAADLLEVLRPILASHPHRENAYVALDAVAWTAAIIIVGTEERDARDFFALALTQNLADLENSTPTSDDPNTPAAPEVSEKDER